jgi:uncharacterized protein (TIGR00730 family)
VQAVGGKPGSLPARLIHELIETGLKLIPDGRDLGEIKLITNSVKEMRYAYRIFGEYPDEHKVTIFGSARTPEDHPDYAAAVEFSRLMAEAGWMSITGAGGGIMKAGHEGPGREQSFGVAIRLPFEQTTNDVIEGDKKLIHFRYFFTRKLMFVSQAEAVVIFPGGFGTMDELYETLTLVQTGKASPMPIVLMQGASSEKGFGEGYWESWDRWVREQLMGRGWISPEDDALWYIARDAADALNHIQKFYRMYHSSRYVRDDFVIRLEKPLSESAVAALNREFADPKLGLVREGPIVQRGPYEVEEDHLDLPRVAFHHTRKHLGLIRKMIDRINELG